MSDARPVKIAVMALGGQGGAVLADWVVKAGERAGYIAQSTSVPGVAQRTGATVYYIEFFPRAAAEAKGKPPVLALMPAPGDVDIVIAAEMMEAGRALARGFVTGATTLIASTHRVYAIAEKIAMGDGRRDTSAVEAEAQSAAGRCIWFDMDEAAQSAGAVISAVMVGALAGSGATPISRAVFEDAIRESGRSVENNLRGFEIGFDAAASRAPAPAPREQARSPGSEDQAAAVAALLARMDRFPVDVRSVLKLGLEKVVDFQDVRYGHLYLDRMEKFHAIDGAAGGDRRSWRLTRELTRHLALWMAYDDVIRVADLKTRSSRFKRVREDVRAEEGQIVHVSEYMRPRVEEMCDLMPSGAAKAVLGSAALRKAFGAVLGKGRRVPTTKLRGFLMLYALAALRFARRAGYRYAVEQARIENWLAIIKDNAPGDYALACEIAGLQRLIKGYGETHERGLRNFEEIVSQLGLVKSSPDPGSTLAALRDAALADEDGIKLRAQIGRLRSDRAAAA